MLFKIKKKFFKFIFKFTPILRVRISFLRIAGYVIGKDVYLPNDLKISDLGNRRNNIEIGDRASIGPGVIFITDSGPNNSNLKKKYPLISDNIIIEEDVWIGARVIILPGTHIGKCSIIGAGSVLNKEIPAYSVAIGMPAKIIKKLNPNEL
jgi:maltose O-acetyltransferase